MLVAAERISKRYRSGHGWNEALKRVSFEMDEGEFVAIMGPSGSGKTTLINLLGLLDRPSEGRLKLAGRDITALSADERARFRNQQIGFVFQAYNLLARHTVIENIEMPLLYAGVRRAERLKRAGQSLHCVGLADRAGDWPVQLSGGEQQRIAIARAIVTEPGLILADEPTGALDSQTGQMVLSIFQALNRAGRGIMIVTHNADVARHAKRVIEMRDGEIVADRSVNDRLDASSASERLVEETQAQQLFSEVHR